MQLRSIGFPYCDGGITNQKIAILNLFLAVKRQNIQIVLPKILNIDHVNANNFTRDFGDVFDIQALQNFCEMQKIKLASGEYEDVTGFLAFTFGSINIENFALAGRLTHYSFTAEFLRSLRPNILKTNTFLLLKDKVYKQTKVDGVIQLRIEKDWIKYSRDIGNFGETDEYLPTFQRIMEKIRNSFPKNLSKLYVVCDEKALSVHKNEIREQVLEEFGFQLFWKSDFIPPVELENFSNIELSLIDFEIAKLSSVFIGLTTSTFSNFITLERYFAKRSSVDNHYIYNAPGDFLSRRFDNGTFTKVDLATTRSQGDEFLFKTDLSHSEILGSLTTHIGYFGDFSSYGLLYSGYSLDRKHLIQGFMIELYPNQKIQLEYCSSSEVGVWTDWVQEGTFSGSRGMAKDLIGYAVRVVKGLPDDCEILAFGKFLDDDNIIEVTNGLPCVGSNNTPLAAMQIKVRRKKSSY